MTWEGRRGTRRGNVPGSIGLFGSTRHSTIFERGRRHSQRGTSPTFIHQQSRQTAGESGEAPRVAPMADQVRRLLLAIDASLALKASSGERLDLFLLGRSALILGYGQVLMTKDVDVVHVHDSPLREQAIREFGRGTPAATELGVFLESVSSGLPPLPPGYQTRCSELDGTWKVLRPRIPEANDLAATNDETLPPEGPRGHRDPGGSRKIGPGIPAEIVSRVPTVSPRTTRRVASSPSRTSTSC